MAKTATSEDIELARNDLNGHIAEEVHRLDNRITEEANRLDNLIRACPKTPKLLTPFDEPGIPRSEDRTGMAGSGPFRAISGRFGHILPRQA